MQKITPCLWFNDQAEEAAKFYCTVFTRSKIGAITHYPETISQVAGRKSGSVMTVSFELEGFSIEGLNGGPEFKFNPSISLYVSCDSKEEIKEKWAQLSKGGKVNLGLDKYPWAEMYGWCADKYGVQWQLILTPNKEDKKIVPAFLFVDKLFGKGEETINFYMSIFENSKMDKITRDEATESIMHCSFKLGGQSFVAMEGRGEHNFTFNHATSLIVYCKDQVEVDKFWNKLSAGGSTEPCGWLKDKFGVSWQIMPMEYYELITKADPAKIERAMGAMLKMKKLDIATLKNA